MNADAALRMSVLTAVMELRTASILYPGEALERIAKLLAERGLFSLDFELAINLDREYRWFDLPATEGRINELRKLIKHVLDTSSPVWLAAIPRGLRLVRETVTEDILQVLESAQLMGDSIDRRAIEWWDQFSVQTRGELDQQRLAQGRQAEEMSLEFEQQRLATQGVEHVSPRWMAIEDNSLGYDLLSYRRSITGAITEVLIEVKSTTRDMPSFYVTRNEWKRASNALDRYIFHIWTAGSSEPLELPATDVKTHIPQDCGAGAWQDVLIQLNISAIDE